MGSVDRGLDRVLHDDHARERRRSAEQRGAECERERGSEQCPSEHGGVLRVDSAPGSRAPASGDFSHMLGLVKAYAGALLAAVSVALLVSGVSPRDRTTWWLEVFPVLIAAPVLIATFARFPLTPLAYTLIALHALILILGGHYTYAQVPLGFWAQDWLGLARNHYDRLGHFAQGFVPAIVAREVLLRMSPLRPGRWLFFLVTATCLFIHAAGQRLLYPAPPRPSGDVALDAAAERIWLEGAGARTEAFFLASTAPVNESTATPLVLYAHGNGELIDYWLDQFEPL